MTLRTSVFIAASLDGYIARPDGGIDWLPDPPADEEHGYDAFIRDVDLHVIGRGTFEKVLTFDGWAYGSRRVLVLSRTLHADAIPKSVRATVSLHRGPVDAAFVRELESSGVTHAYVDGGQVIQSFLRAGLIDDMIITHIPVLIGRGLPLFGALPADIWWEHRSTRAFSSGLVQSSYRRAVARGPG